MGVKLISPPATTVITLAQAKEHLHVDHSYDDALITDLIKSATRHCEVFLGRALIDQTWDLYLDSFPTLGDREIKVPKPPLITVLRVAYDDTGGIESFVDPDDYYVDSVSEPGWVVPISGADWPDTLDAINAVRVRFRAGYLDTASPPANAVPDDIAMAVKLYLGSLYEHRESEIVGVMATAMPWSAEQLLRQHRIELSMA